MRTSNVENLTSHVIKERGREKTICFSSKSGVFNADTCVMPIGWDITKRLTFSLGIRIANTFF